MQYFTVSLYKVCVKYHSENLFCPESFDYVAVQSANLNPYCLGPTSTCSAVNKFKYGSETCVYVNPQMTANFIAREGDGHCGTTTSEIYTTKHGASTYVDWICKQNSTPTKVRSCKEFV
jgi:hypothetical protein